MSDANQTQMSRINEAEVKRIINNALLNATGDTIVEKSAIAFRALQKRRRTAEWVNMELAAAEHYMYMRFLAGSTGDSITSYAPSLYNLKKRIFFALDIQDLMRTTDYPCLPPSKESVAWGEKGVQDGLQDFKDLNPNKDLQLGAALSPLAKGSY